MSNDKRRWIEGIVFLVAFGLTIPAANWMIGNVGTFCVPNGPCPVTVPGPWNWPFFMSTSTFAVCSS